MKKLILHVGPHKTGSTYIQSLLHNNRSTLSQHGIAYPDIYNRRFGHHYLLSNLIRPKDPANIRAELDAGTGGQETCILSSETLINLKDNDMKKLRHAFVDCDVRVVVYARRPSLRLVSLWHEKIKHGSVMPMESYMFGNMLRPRKNPSVNIGLYVDRLLNQFESSSVKIVDYDSANSEGSLMQIFFEASDLNRYVGDRDIKRNTMLDLGEVEIIRYLNYVANKREILEGPNIRKQYLSVTKKEVASLNETLKKGIRGHMKTVTLGTTGIDNAVASMMKKSIAGMSLIQLAIHRQLESNTQIRAGY